MMMLVNGDYVPQENHLRSVEGDEAVLQRMLMKLTARRGQFPFMTMDFGPFTSSGTTGCGGAVCAGGPPR